MVTALTILLQLLLSLFSNSPLFKGIDPSWKAMEIIFSYFLRGILQESDSVCSVFWSDEMIQANFLRPTWKRLAFTPKLMGLVIAKRFCANSTDSEKFREKHPVFNTLCARMGNTSGTNVSPFYGFTGIAGEASKACVNYALIVFLHSPFLNLFFLKRPFLNTIIKFQAGC